jgi:hypothetical protein
MGGSSSRDHRRNNPPVVRNQQQAPPQQRQVTQMPSHLQTQFRRQQQGPPPPAALPPGGGMSPASRNAIQEGKKVKTLATVEPTSVHFEPEFQLLTFRLTSDVTTFTWYEVHTGVRETIKENKVVYTPNKPKAAPQRMRLDGPQDDSELAVQLDVTNMGEQELKFTQLYPKQRPCVLVIGYTDDDGHESMEHTSIDLSPAATRRVIGQIVETGGACYSAESVFGGDHEVVAGSIVEGTENGGTSPATGGVVDADDEDDKLCVICLTNEKDTAVIPCRHLCLCKECAGTLMQHTPKCPVCRGPIAQLLHMGE